MEKTGLEKWIESIHKENTSVDLTDEFFACLSQLEPKFEWFKTDDNHVIIGDDTYELKKIRYNKVFNTGTIDKSTVQLVFKTVYDNFARNFGNFKRLYLKSITASPVKWRKIEQIGNKSIGYRHLDIEFLAIHLETIHKSINKQKQRIESEEKERLEEEAREKERQEREERKASKMKDFNMESLAKMIANG